ncbi:MAG TPA: hypothetical protein VFM46_01440 [Pseudomonadales bacterium]|nr:hypothetical protein [Pseudomonadales bacterium]
MANEETKKEIFNAGEIVYQTVTGKKATVDKDDGGDYVWITFKGGRSQRALRISLEKANK